MSKRVYYERVGRRYVPVTERDSYGALTAGTYLVKVVPGGRTVRRVLGPIDLNLARVQYELVDALCHEMVEIDRPGPVDRAGRRWIPSRYEVATKAVERVIGLILENNKGLT